MLAALEGRNVIELACGSGHWTAHVASVAKSILGCDFSPEMLEIAASKTYEKNNASFREANVYELDSVGAGFDGGLSARWFSHVPKSKHFDFLSGWHEHLESGAVVFVMDDQLTDYWRPATHELPGEVDIYQTRKRPDGSTVEIIKNFFDEDELQAIFGPHASEMRIGMSEHWWWVCYTVP
jgi:trans-aconitate methyltransferase